MDEPIMVLSSARSASSRYTIVINMKSLKVVPQARIMPYHIPSIIYPSLRLTSEEDALSFAEQRVLRVGHVVIACSGTRMGMNFEGRIRRLISNLMDHGSVDVAGAYEGQGYQLPRTSLAGGVAQVDYAIKRYACMCGTRTCMVVQMLKITGTVACNTVAKSCQSPFSRLQTGSGEIITVLRASEYEHARSEQEKPRLKKAIEEPELY
ncbi:hypothetical protein DEU56DRAFT_899819 [Suillus clintonianus]|uniref:uncharacterized protein n=1 Tax=Suillus clintonianus TaxID=1904413 RepID=UPI001B860E5A|nr:uncharacterized protein DEU56DRAFT_899819 [Suillus clintonianus]KAG2145810.1 hypothetical protein DEU56DRAFT_899819 [Suillus clintonianus]